MLYCNPQNSLLKKNEGLHLKLLRNVKLYPITAIYNHFQYNHNDQKPRFSISALNRPHFVIFQYFILIKITIKW